MELQISLQLTNEQFKTLLGWVKESGSVKKAEEEVSLRTILMPTRLRVCLRAYGQFETTKDVVDFIKENGTNYEHKLLYLRNFGRRSLADFNCVFKKIIRNALKKRRQ